MTDDWRLHLGKALSGESLSDDEATVLSEALRDPQRQQDAVSWLHWEEALICHLEPQTSEAIARSKARLRARIILREKHHQVVGREKRPARRYVSLTAIGAVAAMLAILFVAWPVIVGPRSTPVALGDYRVVGWQPMEAARSAIRRGDRLIAGNGGARVLLGKHCELQLRPDCELTIQGAPGKEQIELHHGEVHAKVEPRRGSFRILTPLGPVDVTGTEFTTSVSVPPFQTGVEPMSLLTRRIMVKVAVIAGSVVCYFGDSPIVMSKGMTQSFADEVEETRGVVVETTDFTVSLKNAEGENVTFHVSKESELLVHEVSQLIPGDAIVVAWVEEEGKRWIKDMDGRGEIEGTVTGLGDRWIEVTSGDKPVVRLIPPWLGGNPDQGGGLDKTVLRKLGQVRVGDRVLVVWEMPEGKRVVDVKKLGDSPRESEGDDEPFRPIPKGVQGFRGILYGTIVERNVERGQFELKVSRVGRVWQESEASNPESAVGETIKIKLTRESRLAAEHRETFETLRQGDRVEVEAFHLDEGVLTVMELLRKVD